jgi:hypothetical protein
MDLEGHALEMAAIVIGSQVQAKRYANPPRVVRRPLLMPVPPQNGLTCSHEPRERRAIHLLGELANSN